MSKPNLADALKDMKSKPSQTAMFLEPETGKVVVRPKKERKPPAPSRVGKVNVHFPLSPSERNILKILAIELGQSVEHLVIDAVNETLQRHGRPTIEKIIV